MLDRVREASALAITVVLALQVASSLFVNAVVFQGEIGAALRRLHLATGGLVESTLVANLVPLVLVVGVGVFLVARLRPNDIGLIRSALPVAVVATLGYWLASQAVFSLVAIGRGEALTLNPAWVAPGAGFVVGGLLAQLFGNALAEEAIFRGFLFPQFLAKLRHRMRGRGAIVVAALASQVVFAVLHIPNRLLTKGFGIGSDLLGDQAALVLSGLVFLTLYAASRNLLATVGVHALWNDPVGIMDRPDGPVGGLAVLGLTLALAAILYVRRRRLGTTVVPKAA